MITPEYVAGFMDADGCVYINATKNRAGGVSHALRAEIANTDPIVLERMQEDFGGFIHKARTVGRRFPAYKLAFTGNDAHQFIERIYPHLIVKKTQAWLALEYWAQTDRKAKGQGVRLADSEVALREGYKLAMRYEKEHRVDRVTREIIGRVAIAPVN